MARWNCPRCQSPKLETVAALQLEGDAWNDEISLQWAICECGFKAVLVYEESRRGSLDHDCWSHIGHPISTPDWDATMRWLGLCPSNQERDCQCCAHQHFSRCDQHGRWQGLQGYELGKPFLVS